MSDLINGRTLEEIITGLKCEVTCSKCAYREHNFMKDDSCSYYVEQDVIALIEHLESERGAALAKQPKWISAKERMPEEHGIYLAHIVHRYCKIDSYSRVAVEYFSRDGEWDSLPDLYEVTHWMPLPEPPEEEG